MSRLAPSLILLALVGCAPGEIALGERLGRPCGRACGEDTGAPDTEDTDDDTGKKGDDPDPVDTDTVDTDTVDTDTVDTDTDGTDTDGTDTGKKENDPDPVDTDDSGDTVQDTDTAGEDTDTEDTARDTGDTDTEDTAIEVDTDVPVDTGSEWTGCTLETAGVDWVWPATTILNPDSDTSVSAGGCADHVSFAGCTATDAVVASVSDSRVRLDAPVTLLFEANSASSASATCVLSWAADLEDGERATGTYSITITIVP